MFYAPIKYPAMRFTLITLAVSAILVSCDKKDPPKPKAPEPVNTDMTPGMGNNSRNIHGYFYASYRQSPSPNEGYLTGFAVFGDPARHLMGLYDHYNDNERFSSSSTSRGNISVGMTSFAGRNLSENNNPGFNLSYRLHSFQTIYGFDYSCNWHTEGNGSFKPVDLSVDRGFPRIARTTDTPTMYINKSADFILDLKGLVSNYDSVYVRIPSFNGFLEKRISATSSIIVFSQASLAQIFNGTTMTIMAYNYSHKIINSKEYIFELAEKQDILLLIDP